MLDHLVLGNPDFVRSAPCAIAVTDVNGKELAARENRCNRAVIDDHQVGIRPIAAPAKRVLRAFPGKSSEKIVAIGADANIHPGCPATAILL
jgi:hypothetical protein